MKYQLEFYTGYQQFFICDKNPPGQTNSDNFRKAEAFEERLAVEDGIVGVGIAKCFETISVHV